MIKITKTIAVACLMALSPLSYADAVLYWTETGASPRPFVAGPAYLKSGTNLPGGAVNSVVSGASKIKGPGGVEIIDGRVWWTDQQLGTIQSVKPDGSDRQSYAAGNPYDIDVVGSTLYWTQNSAGTINVIDTAAAVPVSSVLIGSLSQPMAIDLVGNYIYWSEVAGVDRLRRSTLDGTSAITLASNVQSYDFEVTPLYIYLTTTFGTVLRTNLDGTGSITLANNLGFLNGIDVTDDLIYVSDLFGHLYSMDLLGQNLSPLYSSGDAIRGVAYLPQTPTAAAPAATVPVSSTLALFGCALFGVGAWTRRRPQ